MLSGNFDEFDEQLERAATDMLAALYSRVMRKVTLDVFGILIRATPVDTGRARFGWDVSVVSASAFVPPEGAKSYPAADIAKALGALSSLQYGDDVWICNNVVYIKRLNEGWSQQMPAGFVESALQAAARALGA